MANKIRAKLALQLREAGVSANKVYETHRISKKSQREVLEAASKLGITYADIADMPDDEVYRLLFPDRNNHVSVFEQPDWEYVHRELAKVGVTLQLLHLEYRDVCAENGKVAMGYDRFYKRYGAFTVSKQVTSRVGHKAARICEVDWSGPTMAVVDPVTGEISKVHLFVATLPFSRYSYVEPTLDMTEDTWLRCHVRMFEFFGGSVPMIVPDNLKTGVIRHPREGEVVLNEAYEALAAHYSSAVMAARVGAPKDKPSAEGTVGNIATEVIAKLRNVTFTSMGDLRAAVAERLAAYNAAPFQKRDGSRLKCFIEEEKPLLRPLPAVPYEVCRWVYGRKVQLNCHVCWQRNFYSVSHRYVGKRVDLRITDTLVEIYLDGKVEQLIKRAHLRYPDADVRRIDFADDRGLDRMRITELATCGYAERGNDIVLQGFTGGGKSYLSCALAKEACKRRMRAMYVRVPDLEEEFRISKLKPGATRKLIRKYGNFQVLVLDEWLLDKPDDDFRSMLMEFMELRCDGKSTIFCTQYQKKDWHARLRGGVHADAIMDRIAHSAIWIETGEVNMRAKLSTAER